jgi:dihydrofolate reductase
MRISIIAAVGQNLEIGKGNDLLWHLADDMVFFRKTTLHHHIVMGRKNYESIPQVYRPLKNRTNIVITRDKHFAAEGCFIVHSLQEAVKLAERKGEDELMIIGGGMVYADAFAQLKIDTIYLTHVAASFPDAEVYFPAFDQDHWNRTALASHEADEKNDYRFDIFRYDKK